MARTEAKSGRAPYLTGLRLIEDEAPDPIQRQGPRTVDVDPSAGSGDDWAPEDFPAWYRDKLATSDQEPGDQEPGDEQDDDSSGSGYPLDLAVVQTVAQLQFGAVTVLAGDNGSGKSTLIEAIAVAAGFNAEGGSRNLLFKTNDTHSRLHEQLVLEWRSKPRWGWFLRAETFYGMATHIEQDDDPYAGVAAIFPDLHNRSHGESFLELARSRFTGRGLYMLDEPESALSIQGLMALLAIMDDSLKAGSQFIISTHSPLLMAYPSAALYQLDAADGVERCDFDDLVSTSLWRRFFDDPQSFYGLLED